MIVFLAGQKLPGDPGRAILGPLAQESGVRQLDHRLGVDRPLLTQYKDWLTNLVHGDMGTSYEYSRPIAPMIRSALANSLKLALVAFLMCVPLSILAGVVAALSYGKWPDRTISVIGLSALGLPEFVSGVFLILIFGIWLNVLPLDATPPPGAGVGTQVYHLIMPAIPITLVLFGYIMRMARAGTIAVLDADYTRTAVLKGLSRRAVILHHVLPNALLPTITVVAISFGWLIGGLIVIENVFNYPGLGRLLVFAIDRRDLPLLQAITMITVLGFALANLAADLLYVYLNPRIRLS